MSKLATALTISPITYLFKAFRTFGLRSFDVEGRDILLKALKEPKVDAAGVSEAGAPRSLGSLGDDAVVDESIKVQPVRRGIVTICNHNSVIDDPMIWSILPTTNYFPFASPTHTSRNNRWTLGASDIMFTKPLHSKFFTAGQVIETFRGKGVFQPAIDQAVKLLQQGEWVHIFPEGKVNQPKMNPEGGLFRFKWGVGRIIMDSKIMPEIIPMWISGFDQVMNEYRGFPRFIPRPGGRLSMTIGEPITAKIQPLVDRWRDLAAAEKGSLGIGGEWHPDGGDGQTLDEGTKSHEDARQRTVRGQGHLAGGAEEEIRRQIVSVLQEEVRKLGERVERKEGRYERGEWTQSRKMGESSDQADISRSQIDR